MDRNSHIPSAAMAGALCSRIGIKRVVTAALAAYAAGCIVTLVWGAGSLLGPLIGGVFSATHRWRWAFSSYAVGTAAVGIAANAAGLANGAAAPVVKAAGFWVFAAFVPVLSIGVASAWVFTGKRPALEAAEG